MGNMPGATNEENCERLYREDEDERTLQSLRQELRPQNKVKASSLKGKVTNYVRKCNGNLSSRKKIINKISKKKKIVSKAIVQKAKTAKKLHKRKAVSTRDGGKTDEVDSKPEKLKRRKRKKRKINVELDEAARLQNKTRYLLMKMRQEQNLIDAYSAEGWKGQSREKIKPEKELQRAKKQILKCKLGIRDAIRQLDSLSSEGRINDSNIAPDGSVHHEHIICAKCVLSEAFPDNDIILCDGSCNRAFHQQCLDPPLLTENIPPSDEGWFCNFCKKKIEIIEATNAHLGTHFLLDVGWEDVFKEEAALPDDGNLMLCPEGEWPSDDSEDDDYDPDRIEHSGSDNDNKYVSDSNAADCSSSYSGSLDDETILATGRVDVGSNRSVGNSLDINGVDSDDINNGEVISQPRQRAAVDYIKLHDEMFGKNANENEEISDDEDWGPRKRKRRAKEANAATMPVILGENDDGNSEETSQNLKERQLIKKMKRPIFRLPHDAVEKLRIAFAENELPERAVRVNLSQQLGLEVEKVNKWFKNSRYLALKARKQAERAQASNDNNSSIPKGSASEIANDSPHDETAVRMNTASQKSKGSEKLARRRDSHLQVNSSKIKQQGKPISQKAGTNQMAAELGDDVSLKQLREKAKEDKKKRTCQKRSAEQEAEAEMERLCQLKTRVEKLQEVLLKFPSRPSKKRGTSKDRSTNSRDPAIVYVPVAELKEKR
ncbi:pathogenesis-related homeodomain protein [Andrographis paniculata]|uniref:pathogenesis-related homeodomain protein n=1 Tax=Andrographis paniculata TaxID=175694 RepID=UPI0021E830C8|nr:pathogenesis-related homeodomain protein [Andrographis paniculata]